MNRLIEMPVLYVFYSFVLAGLYWFFVGLIFGVPVAPFLALWRVVYILALSIDLFLLAAITGQGYINEVERGWESDMRFLQWAKVREGESAEDEARLRLQGV